MYRRPLALRVFPAVIDAAGDVRFPYRAILFVVKERSLHEARMRNGSMVQHAATRESGGNMGLDFAAVREGRLSYADAVGNMTATALRTAMADLYSTIEGIIAGLSDHEVVFQSVDPDAHDQFAAEG